MNWEHDPKTCGACKRTLRRARDKMAREKADRNHRARQRSRGGA